MRTLILFLCFIPVSGFAEWSIGALKLELSPCPGKPCEISSSCLSSSPKCEALRAMKNPHKGSPGPGGSNPGSKICREKFHGRVNVATDSSGNEQAFCRFRDGSLLSLPGVWTF